MSRSLGGFDLWHNLPVVEHRDQRHAAQDIAQKGRYEKSGYEIADRCLSDLHQEGALNRSGNDVGETAKAHNVGDDHDDQRARTLDCGEKPHISAISQPAKIARTKV